MAGQYALHQEKEVYRLVITSGSSTTHPVLGVFAQKGCVPAAVALASGGTISTFNTDASGGTLVTGVGTSFLNDVDPGDYLTDTNGVVRRVKGVNSNTQLTIEDNFPTSLSAYTATIIKKKQFYTEVEARSTGSGNAILQEQTFIVNDIFVGNGAPLSYDVTGSNAQISFTLHI